MPKEASIIYLLTSLAILNFSYQLGSMPEVHLHLHFGSHGYE